jgi:hypothetical protein
MIQITQEDLLQFLYKEGNPEKNILIQQLIEVDSNVKERFEILKSSKNRLEKIKLMSPDARSVDNILNYSKQGLEIFH